jgi:hypothetical protein
MRFEWHPIRSRDEDGHLMAAGVQWTERREVAEIGWTLLVIACFGTAVGVLVSFAMTGATPTGVWTIAALIVACVYCVYRACRVPGRRRALIFHRDGRTTAPFGFAHYRRRFRELSAHNAEFVSIEARGQQEAGSDVLVFTRCGDVVYAGGRLDPDHAHKVAVQLTLALSELRESMSGANRTGNETTKEPALIE